MRALENPESVPERADAAPHEHVAERAPRLLFFAVPLVVLSLTGYLVGVAASLPRVLFFNTELAREINGWIVWYSGVPMALGLAMICLDLFLLMPGKRKRAGVMNQPLANDELTVVLTAYNDEVAIVPSVKDFLAHPKVKRVIVVDNNSKDRTAERAREAGAEVVIETQPGYGRCVYRCLKEGASHKDTVATLLCEGDMTFRAQDIDKFLAYSPHATIVNGTRIVEQLREYRTQLSTSMYYGNFAVGKLLEVKHLGRGTFTDVGTTYKLLRNDAIERLLPKLDPSINLPFNCHFLDVALGTGERMVECPITFYPRVGVSKGGNVNNLRAISVGLQMILGLYTAWRFNRS
jgi:hypothetical protein